MFRLVAVAAPCCCCCRCEEKNNCRHRRHTLAASHVATYLWKSQKRRSHHRRRPALNHVPQITRSSFLLLFARPLVVACSRRFMSSLYVCPFTRSLTSLLPKSGARVMRYRSQCWPILRRCEGECRWSGQCRLGCLRVGCHGRCGGRLPHR